MYMATPHIVFVATEISHHLFSIGLDASHKVRVTSALIIDKKVLEWKQDTYSFHRTMHILRLIFG